MQLFFLGSANDLCSTPKKRRCAKPRYISEIMTPNVRTPFLFLFIFWLPEGNAVTHTRPYLTGPDLCGPNRSGAGYVGPI